jgi:16S rRNA (cytidine1402-2'-O)-methyltransferase
MVIVLGPQRRITIARELTKTFESFYRCPLGEAHDWLQADANRQRGEFVLLVEAAPPAEDDADAREAERVLRLLLADLPLKQAVKLAVDITGGKKNALYQLALQLNDAQD